jgi:prepilin-type N-terminal cleavage/methylation domain-containing protein
VNCLHRKGFTLAELLICLAILAEIATFTIPKVFASQQNVRYAAMAKEAAGALSVAYLQYTIQNGPPSSNTTGGVLSPYLNYISMNTTTLQIDRGYSQGTIGCSGAIPCFVLASGGYYDLPVLEDLGG